MSELQKGALLLGGKYKIVKTLGQGGFGITYLAEQTNLGRKVCIKEFFMKEYSARTTAPPGDVDATVLTSVTAVTSAAAEVMGKYRDKFEKEAKTIARLEHPGIVRIHDVFKENGTAYYVMDFIDGENLNEMVKRNGPLPEERAMGYIRQVADALSYVHSHKIMHLDVKPANILVRKLDDKAILIDFGTAKQYDSEGTQTSTTPVGLSVGYAPIEMMKLGGVKTFSPETDVYSLGATLYYMVTGKNPPDASERMEMLMEGESFKFPKRVPAYITKAVDASMRTRNQRPKSVEAFMDLLDSKKEKASNSANGQASGEPGRKNPTTRNSKTKSITSRKQQRTAKEETVIADTTETKAQRQAAQTHEEFLRMFSKPEPAETIGLKQRTKQRKVLDVENPVMVSGSNSSVDYATNALVTLGFPKADVERIISSILKDDPTAEQIDIVKRALLNRNDGFKESFSKDLSFFDIVNRPFGVLQTSSWGESMAQVKRELSAGFNWRIRIEKNWSSGPEPYIIVENYDRRILGVVPRVSAYFPGDRKRDASCLYLSRICFHIGQGRQYVDRLFSFFAEEGVGFKRDWGRNNEIYRGYYNNAILTICVQNSFLRLIVDYNYNGNPWAGILY